MMRIFLLLIIILTLQSCKGQDKNKQINKFKQETIMETFDIETFNKNKKGNESHFNSDKGAVIRQIELNDGYIETIKLKDSLFETYNEYYKNGILKMTLKSFPDDFEIGILKEFNKQGNLIKETDLDKPFPYNWENVKNYLREHKAMDLLNDIVRIRRFDNPDKTYWELEFQGEYKDLKGQFLIELDGKTGEELLVKLFKGKDSEGEVGTIAVYDTIYKKNNK